MVNSRSLPSLVVALTIGASANAAPTLLQRVEVVGHISPSFGIYIQSPYGSNIGLSPIRMTFYNDAWENQQMLFELAKINPITSNDIRCNTLLSAEAKNVTSRRDNQTRYLAAAELLAKISASNGGRGAKAAISGNAYAWLLLKQVPTFEVIYADGGRERWFLASLVPMALLVDGRVPGSFVEGSGLIEACEGV